MKSALSATAKKTTTALAKTSSLCQILLIGTGLINTSFALAINALPASQKNAFNLVGWDIDKKAAELAKVRNAVSQVAKSLELAIPLADIVVIGVPFSAYKSVFPIIAKYASPDTLITDMGSVKAPVVILAATLMPNHITNFVPAHPIAGMEQSGPGAAIANLFQNQKLILTPNEHTNPVALMTIEKLWQKIGADTSIMTADEHDEVCAAISHVPHLLSMALVSNLIDEHKPNNKTANPQKNAHAVNGNEAMLYAGGGFRDFSRIAGSHPVMWHDIFMANSEAILRRLTSLEKTLKQFRKLLTEKDNNKENTPLYQLLDKISNRQRQWKKEYVAIDKIKQNKTNKLVKH